MSAMKRRPQSISQLHEALAGAENFIEQAGSQLAGEIAPKPTESVIAPKKEKIAKIVKAVVDDAPVASKKPVEVEVKWPWEGIDDKTAKPHGYALNFPPSVYAKLKFLGENEPGGPSVRKLVLEALEPYLAQRLAKYEK